MACSGIDLSLRPDPSPAFATPREAVDPLQVQMAPACVSDRGMERIARPLGPARSALAYRRTICTFE